jgi:Prolyl-tRNA synthetase
LPEVISVASDSGMMGGKISHEFMLLTPVGEDSIAICNDCGFRANMEAAECIVQNTRDAVSNPIEHVYTPGTHTIEAISRFLRTSAEKCCKAVVYQKNADNSYIVLFIRGDLEANETKLTNYLGYDIHPADITEESGLCAGFIGPYGLNGDLVVLFDRSLENSNNLCCGGNMAEYHYTGFDISRDIGIVDYHDFAKIEEGGICPKCSKTTITVSRGIEVGNIFQLGTKYTESMAMQYLDDEGVAHYPVMGCYGIGVGRLVASICEAHHDEYGPIWPMSIAPWQVHLCAVRSDDAAVSEYANRLYVQLVSDGIEVIYDDRSVTAGFMFSDADLLGVPIRVIVSPRNMNENCCEIVARDKSLSMKVRLDNALEKIVGMVRELMI